MTELEAAQQIRDGLLPSPWKFADFALFAVRVTGTGMAYRSGLDEFVWRNPEHYLNEEFLARSNGVPLLLEHPGKALDSKEFASRIIGTLVLPYIKGDEIWSIARVYDTEAIGMMTDGQLSTSPGMVFAKTDGNTPIKLDGDKTLLIEGNPSLICHLAVCPLGVWDKGQNPTGIQNDLLVEGTESMSEETEAEKKAREDKERKDAHPGIEPDQLLSKLDSVLKRMDEMDARDAARKDAAMKDAQARRDAEREPWAKEDAAQCAADDAEEAKAAEEMEKGGEAKEVAADKARKDRRDRMDARRKDAAAMEDKTKKDAEAKEAREDAARKDAQTAADKERADRIAADAAAIAKGLASMPMRHDAADYAAMADAQARADAQAYQPLGLQAPGPLQGETPTAYRVRLLRGVQKHSKPWSGVDLHTLQDAALHIAEGQIYADAALASHNPEGLPEDVLVPRSYTNPDTGHRITEFRGRHTFIYGLKRPSMRATEFLTGKAR